MFLLDLFVITSSLALELIVLNWAFAGLLVLARTWRFARVGHGVLATPSHLIPRYHGDVTADSTVVPQTMLALKGSWRRK